jgi:hypothetical protein
MEFRLWIQMLDYEHMTREQVAEAAWTAATITEREVCAEIANEYSRSAVLGNAEQATAEAIGKTIRMRSNVELSCPCKPRDSPQDWRGGCRVGSDAELAGSPGQRHRGRSNDDDKANEIPRPQTPRPQSKDHKKVPVNQDLSPSPRVSTKRRPGGEPAGRPERSGVPMQGMHGA